VIVTGGSGKAGRETVRCLIEQGYAVRNLDRVDAPEPDVPSTMVDLTDYGATFAAMHGFEAVVHLAADPRPDADHVTGAERFANNTLSTFNVFQAAVALGMERVVWASSETVFGVPFEPDAHPERVPVTEDDPPRPRSAYAISKSISEDLARRMSERHGIPFIGLRFSNILTADDYARVPGYQGDPRLRHWNAWAYIDSRDVASACLAALRAPITGAEVVTIAAADTIMEAPNARLVAEVFPGMTIAPDTGSGRTLLSIDKAKSLLGWEPKHSWRDTIKG
jgi:nucleoside-diphosphate-sugar epimerase